MRVDVLERLRAFAVAHRRRSIEDTLNDVLALGLDVAERPDDWNAMPPIDKLHQAARYGLCLNCATDLAALASDHLGITPQD